MFESLGRLVFRRRRWVLAAAGVFVVVAALSAQRTLAALPTRYVAKPTSYWTTRAQELVSADRHATYAVLELAGADGDARQQALAQIKHTLAAPGLSTRVGGEVSIDHDIDAQVGADIGRAESLSMPLLLVLLVVVFGALAAAGMPARQDPRLGPGAARSAPHQR